MAQPWFRMYAEFRNDPKVRTMTDPQQIQLVRLLCLRGSDGPTEKLSESDLSFAIGCQDLETFRETKRVFLDKGFIDKDWRILNWNKRQYASDLSTERVRKFRAKNKLENSRENSHETFHETLDETLDETQMKRDETFFPVSCNVLKQKQAQSQAEQSTTLFSDETLHETHETQNETSPDTDTELSTRTKEKEIYKEKEFFDGWNARCGSLPRAEVFSVSRKAKLHTRIQNGLTLDRFFEAVENCRVKPFLSGDNDRGWKASFDWLIANDLNIEKAITHPYGMTNGGNNGNHRNGHATITARSLDAVQDALQRQQAVDGAKNHPRNVTPRDDAESSDRDAAANSLVSRPAMVLEAAVDGSVRKSRDDKRALADASRADQLDF